MEVNSQKPRRVLVLGAGASACCGFPLGNEFVDLLTQPLTALCPSLQLPDEHSKAEELARKHFVKTCRDTTYATIDELLSKRVELRVHGAVSIAAALIGCQLEVVRNRKTHSQWHRTLYSKLLRGSEWWKSVPAEEDGGFSIVTYNYDVNPQVAIARHLHVDSGIDAAVAWSHAKSCPIVHVHGCLGLNEEITKMLAEDDHRPIITMELIRAASRTLALSTDEALQLDAESLQRSRELIWNATDVAFMGFGFDPRNLDRIGIGKKHPRWISNQRRLLATSVAMSTDKLNAAARECCFPIDFVESSTTLTAFVSQFIDGTYKFDRELIRYPQS